MSSEKQFEHIENKIIEAAKSNHIVFEEASWAKMEVLLDKEDKRKPFFWLWFLVPIVLVSAYGLFTLSKNNDKILAKNSNENTIKKIKANAKSTIQIPTNKEPINAVDDSIITDSNTNNINSNTAIVLIASTEDNNIVSATKKKQSFLYSFHKKVKSIAKNEVIDARENGLSQNNTKINNESKIKTTIKGADASEDDVVVEKINNSQKINITSLKKDTNLISEIKKDSNISIVKISTSKKEKKNPFKILSRFYVLGAAGADIGSVKLFSFGNSSSSAKYGASIGYSISKKINVQAGIYASKKKYIAGPEDYNVKAGSYWSTVPITKVEAACLIYEVPIAAQYHFLQKKSFNAYVGTGLSSYIMKTEDYTYFYKRYNVDYARSFSYTGNQHLFSTALLSVGVEKNISKRFAIQFEPTISIPLIGVGDGTVKLFSTSLLLGVKYRPFNK
jgi:Outer membrane protein beta-barrel domain